MMIGCGDRTGLLQQAFLGRQPPSTPRKTAFRERGGFMMLIFNQTDVTRLLPWRPENPP